MVDIRWKQRFHNFQNAHKHLQQASRRESEDWLIAAGIVQTFEFTFELAWKTLKDYMEELGDEAKFPREVIKNAFEKGLIVDGHKWIEMLNKRNELSHTYNEEQAKAAVSKIVDEYLPAISQVYDTLREKFEQ